VLIGLSVLS